VAAPRDQHAAEVIMAAAHPADLDVLEASAALRSGELSSRELTAACLERIVQRDARFGAFIRVYETQAARAALRADELQASGSAGPLTGVPIALKDVIGSAGLPLTADSALLEGNVAADDATVWARLGARGMVLVGHLHCGEFASGVWGLNPWGPSFSPGGSSSGSGIALAARMVPATLGTDTRGSIRMPAAFTGVSGIKPTFGLVSTAGVIPFSYTSDVVGPMARSAADCAALLQVMAGRDRADRATLAQPRGPAFYPTEPRPGQRPLAGVRIGIPDFAGDPPSPGVAEVYARFQDDLAGRGAELVSFPWPANPLERGEGRNIGSWTHILGAEIQVIHEQFADRRHLYRDEFLGLLAPLRTAGTAIDYVRAQLARAQLADTWTRIFAEHELSAVAHPACQDELFRTDVELTYEELPRLMLGVWNDTGFPVVSIPGGLSPADQSPVGMQLAGLPHDEAVLLQIAIDVQAVTDYHRQSPADLDSGRDYTPPARRNAGPQPPYVPGLSALNAVVPVNPTARGEP
jgi:aspartyl-tRNA(Asn)/glutamyl-tRNA(Gln) amidotransferase subunit A